jgi:indigoidine synthase A like protein
MTTLTLAGAAACILGGAGTAAPSASVRVHGLPEELGLPRRERQGLHLDSVDIIRATWTGSAICDYQALVPTSQTVTRGPTSRRAQIRGALGASTVGATPVAGRGAGIRFVATGGIDGVHRGSPLARRTSRPNLAELAAPRSSSSAPARHRSSMSRRRGARDAGRAGPRPAKAIQRLRTLGARRTAAFRLRRSSCAQSALLSAARTRQTSP